MDVDRLVHRSGMLPAQSDRMAAPSPQGTGYPLHRSISRVEYGGETGQ
jgi:hypothetical protein